MSKEIFNIFLYILWLFFLSWVVYSRCNLRWHALNLTIDTVQHCFKKSLHYQAKEWIDQCKGRRLSWDDRNGSSLPRATIFSARCSRYAKIAKKKSSLSSYNIACSCVLKSSKSYDIFRIVRFLHETLSCGNLSLVCRIRKVVSLKIGP